MKKALYSYLFLFLFLGYGLFGIVSTCTCSVLEKQFAAYGQDADNYPVLLEDIETQEYLQAIEFNEEEWYYVVCSDSEINKPNCPGKTLSHYCRHVCISAPQNFLELDIPPPFQG